MVEAARADLEQSAAAAEGSAQEQTLRGCASSSPPRRPPPRRSPTGCASSSRSPARRTPTCAASCTRPASGQAAEARAAEGWRRAEEARAAAVSAGSAGESELRRLRERLADAERQLKSTRRAAREGRSVEDARVRVLLDALQDAAAGLRRELALPSTISRPADSVAAVAAERPGCPRACPRGPSPTTTPPLLDQLLALPQVHLIVDGYNVTKTGYRTLSWPTSATGCSPAWRSSPRGPAPR